MICINFLNLHKERILKTMDQLFLFTSTIFMGFFAIMNPLANAPIFIALTQNIEDNKKKKKIAFNSVLYAFIIVAVFCISGQIIFKLFGITLPAFQITGGALLFLVGFHMVNGQHSAVQHPNSDHVKEEVKQKVKDASSSIAISPLAIPLLAGPGTISTAMNFVGEKSGLDPFWHTTLVVGVFLSMCVITYLFFIGGQRIVKFLGHGVIDVISRLMGLILAVIAVQMIISGIKNTVDMFFH